MSNKFKTSAMFLLVASAMGLASCSGQPEGAVKEDAIILRFSHFWPSTAALHKDVFEPWARQIEDESAGRLKVEIYPSATLSKPDITYDSTAKGTVDIGAQVQGYISGRFPLTEITQLPGLSSSGTQLSCMLQTLYDDDVIASEYEDTHPLFMMASGPGAFHTIDKPIRKPEDLKGMRIRRPLEIAANIIEAAGGTPVGMPASDQYTSLQRGVIDGVSTPWDAAGAFRLAELTNTHTTMPLYGSALLVTMNKGKYESLPDDLKKVIDDNSGMEMAKVAGNLFDSEDTRVIAEAKARGDTMIEIPDPLNDSAWSGILKTEIQSYLDNLEAQGLDAQGVYEKAQAASRACKV
ncbi:TRAP transporter substrate-binding protein [Psychrobacter sp. H8-1]|uniref:TRAP transporter substrate-binding protein n=1 Tax=Psychrobacter sp. H8-1 TaxID=2774129 RepID=UPI00191AEBAE|nr:TRAP transporter substrate-binding protein [Psychrobacter sp. H8-1]